MASKTHHFVPALVLMAGGILWIGCNSNDNSKNAAATAAALPPLPQEDIALLRPVLDQQMLATRNIHVDVQPPPPEGAAHPNCTADDVETDYSAQVSYPVTVCTSLGVVVGTLGGVNAPPTHKLEASALTPAQLAAFGTTTPQETIFWCRQSKGPWQGFLTTEHACSGTCNAQNTLTLTNTPNTITFHWQGSVEAHPNQFSFVGIPKLEGTVDWGKCHPENITPAPAP
jgi:hypothetical protein